jgi:hypothetical protein
MLAYLLIIGLVPQTPRQQAYVGPDSALKACAAAKEDAKCASSDAEKHYRALLAKAPADVKLKALLARTLSECVVDQTSVWGKEGVVKESNKLFLEIDQEQTSYLDLHSSLPPFIWGQPLHVLIANESNLAYHAAARSDLDHIIRADAFILLSTRNIQGQEIQACLFGKRA